MEKFIPKMYLRQPVCTYSTCGPCATNKKNKDLKKKKIQGIFIEANQAKLAVGMIWLMENLSIYQEKRKVLHDKTFNISKNPKYDGCQRGVSTCNNSL